jgi:hypothetical protein
LIFIFSFLACSKKVQSQLYAIPSVAYLRQGDCYLCTGSKVYSRIRQTACCSGQDSDAVWLIEKSGEGSYTIKNIKYEEYLFDADNPGDHSLGLWYPGTKRSLGEWKINHVSCHDFTIESPRGLYINREFTRYTAGRWEIIGV